MSLFATGCWLEMQDLVDDSVDSILRRMTKDSLAPVIQVVSANYYGKPGDRLLASAKAMLCRNGTDLPTKSWDNVPSELVAEIVGSDGFYVRDEWYRWRLAKRLLDRRLKLIARELGLHPSRGVQAPASLSDRAFRPPPTEPDYEDGSSVEGVAGELRLWELLYSHEDVVPLLGLVDTGIHYIHMSFEQLQSIREARDVFGVPVLPEQAAMESLWSNVELRRRVLNATEKELSLGLMRYAPEGQEDIRGDRTNLSLNTLSKASSKQPAKDDVVSASDKTSPPRYIIPNADCNVVLGGNEEPIYTYRNTDSKSTTQQRTSGPQPGPVETMLDDGTTTLEVETESRRGSDTESMITYSNYPPFRFAVEFPNTRMLKDRKKVFSHTVFYAGSLWNVYIKKVKSSTKNPHLGVYLHRAPQHQSTRPNAVHRGSVDERIGALEHRMQGRGPRGPPGATYLNYEQQRPQENSQSQGTDSVVSGTTDNNFTNDFARRLSQRFRIAASPLPSIRTPYANEEAGVSASNEQSESPSTSDSENAILDIDSLTYQPRPHVPALSPYVDKRPTIKTYFKIYSPGRGGRMLSVYESVPDKFNFSQSWGWKSSTLMVDDEEEDEYTLQVPETSFVDDEGAGPDLLESGEAQVMAGEQEGRKVGDRGSRSTNSKLRFMVCLGVV